MAKKRQRKAGGDNEGLTLKRLLSSYVEQLGGDKAGALGRKAFRATQGTTAGQELLAWFDKLAGDKGVIEAINVMVGGSLEYLRSRSWDPVYVRPIAAFVDDFFDEIKNGIRENGGKLTPQIVNESWRKTEERHRVYEGAYRNLNQAEQQSLDECVEIFEKDEAQRERWRFWRGKVSQVEELRSLLSIASSAGDDFPEAWERHLRNALGTPPSKSPSQVGRVAEKVKKNIDQRVATATKKLKTHREARTQVRRSGNNRKRFG